MPIAQLPNASTAVKTAQACLASTRFDFNGTGQKLSGPARISAEAKQAVLDFIKEDHVARRLIKSLDRLKPDKAPPDKIVLIFLERFEEYCRRAGCVISADNKIFIYRILVSKLFQASHTFRSKPSAVASAVIQNHDIHKLDRDPEVAEFIDTPWIVKHAVIGNPQNPKAFIQKTQKATADILKDPKFASFADTPSIVKRAAVSYPRKTEAFLEKVIKTTSDILSDLAFAAEKPRIVRLAAVYRPTDPKGYLNKMRAITSEILQDLEFAEFSPSLVKEAAVYHPKDPRVYLRKIKEITSNLLSIPEFATYADTPWIVRLAVVNHPKDPVTFLRKVTKIISEIPNEPEFAELAKSPWVIRHAAIHNLSDPRGFLREVQKQIFTLSKNPKFADCAPSLIKEAVVYHPTDPQAFLLQKKIKNLNLVIATLR